MVLRACLHCTESGKSFVVLYKRRRPLHDEFMGKKSLFKDNKYLPYVTGVIVFGAFVAILYWKNNSSVVVEKKKEAMPDVAVIMKEREQQGQNQMKTPIGNLFDEHKWDDIEKVYDPSKNMQQFSEVIRACFITECFKTFKNTDYERLVSIVVRTLSGVHADDMALAGTMLNQLERLPVPEAGTKNYQAIEAWQKSSNQELKRTAIIKLGIQAASPKQKWVNAVIQAMLSDSLGLTQSAWLQKTGDIRSISGRKTVLEALLKNLNKIKPEARGQILIALSDQPEIAPDKIKKMFFQYLESDHSRSFEAALKSFSPLFHAGILSADDQSRIKNRLNAVPQSLQSPYVTGKVSEILAQLK